MSHEELIARLEKATGPDRGLDGDIAVACADTTGFIERIGNPDGGWVSRASPNSGVVASPNYTASIDAALTLIPKDGVGGWEIGTLYTGRAAATIWNPDSTCPPDRYQLEGATPAIAMCIAALTAMIPIPPREGRFESSGTVTTAHSFVSEKQT